jgi:hypothetical protein
MILIDDESWLNPPSALIVSSKGSAWMRRAFVFYATLYALTYNLYSFII